MSLMKIIIATASWITATVRVEQKTSLALIAQRIMETILSIQFQIWELCVNLNFPPKIFKYCRAIKSKLVAKALPFIGLAYHLNAWFYALGLVGVM